jgi:hypothetical protein
MPKPELHLHLDGSLDPALALELAATRNVDAPRDWAGMRAALVAPERCADQADLLHAFDLPIALLQDAEALDRAAEISRQMKVVCRFIIHTSGGTPYTRSGIYSAYLRADKALHGGAPIGLNPKALRPFAATQANDQGYNKEQLQVGLAHSSIRTTEGYIHQHSTPVSMVRLRLPKA